MMFTGIRNCGLTAVLFAMVIVPGTMDFRVAADPSSMEDNTSQLFDMSGEADGFVSAIPRQAQAETPRAETPRVETPTDDAEVDMECSSVPAFPSELFDKQKDKSKVYQTVQKLVESPKNIFAPLGLTKYIKVFGVPIVASTAVADSDLKHAALVLAHVLDNNQDGIIDRPAAVEQIREYNTVIGYVTGPDESDELWSIKFRKPESEAFRQQFVCSMHFFEQWQSDATPQFHEARKIYESMKSEDKEKACETFVETPFDWPLWYFPFTMSYYGYLEEFDSDLLKQIQVAHDNAKVDGVFSGNYADDKEMEVADFIVWSLLTVSGALECHCNTEIISKVWKLCSREEMQEYNEDWLELLESVEGLPRKIPDGKYKSIAVV